MKIMVYYDDTDAAQRAMFIAKEHAKAFDATIYLVATMAGGVQIPKDKLEKVEKKLDEFAEEFYNRDGVPCKTQVLLSNLSAGEAIVQFSEQQQIDEIVLPVRHRSKVGKLIFGSAQQHVILEAPCIVVSVK